MPQRKRQIFSFFLAVFAVFLFIASGSHFHEDGLVHDDCTLCHVNSQPKEEGSHSELSIQPLLVLSPVFIEGTQNWTSSLQFIHPSRGPLETLSFLLLQLQRSV